MKNIKREVGSRKSEVGSRKWFKLLPTPYLLLTVLLTTYYLLLTTYGLYAVGNTSTEFLLIPKGAKASAMAGTFTSEGNDSTVIYYNPAGLGFLKEKNISLSHSQWLESINFENISYALPLGEKFTIGAGFEYLGIRGIEGKANQLAPLDDFDSYDLSLVGGISCLFNKNISFGLNARYIEEKIDDEKATAVSFDFGGIYKHRINSDKSFSMGMAVQNIALIKPEFINEEENLPTKIVSGVSYRPMDEMLLLSSDLVLMKGSKPSINIGSELFVYDVLSVRLGYKLDPSFENRSRITCGLGVIFESLSVDYAYLPFESLTDTHTFSISYKFE